MKKSFIVDLSLMWISLLIHKDRLIPEFYTSVQEKIFFFQFEDITHLHASCSLVYSIASERYGHPRYLKILSSGLSLARENVSAFNLFPVSSVAPLNQNSTVKEVLLKLSLNFQFKEFH